MAFLRPRRRTTGRGVPRRASRLVCLILATLAGVVARAEDMPLSPDLQVPLILTALKYDRYFGRFGEELTLGIVYTPTDTDSVKAANSVSDTLYRYKGKTVKGLPVRYFTVEYSTPENLERSINNRGLDVLYVAPGSAKNLAGITQVSRELHVTTTTGVPDYVRRGVSVGLGVSQERPQPIINLTSSRLEGCEWDASLLKISTIVK